MAINTNPLLGETVDNLGGSQSQLQKEAEDKKAGEAAMAAQQAAATSLAGDTNTGVTPQAGGAPSPASPAPITLPTFAELQASGAARPPAPAPAITGTTGTGQAGDLRSYIMSILQNPTSFNDADQQARVAREAQGIDDQYAQKEQLTKEDMYRRGLADSTTYGGRLQDLNISKRSAKEDSLMRLEEEAATRNDAARMQAASLGTQILGLDQSGDLARAQMEMQRQLEGTRIALEREVAQGNMTMAQAQFEYNKTQDQFNNDMRQKEFAQHGSEFDTNTMLEILKALGYDTTGYDPTDISNPSGPTTGTSTTPPPQGIPNPVYGPPVSGYPGGIPTDGNFNNYDPYRIN